MLPCSLVLHPLAGTGRIAFFNGYGWSVTRWGADSDRVLSLDAAAPNRCHAVIGTYASQAERLFLWNGASWVLKVRWLPAPCCLAAGLAAAASEAAPAGLRMAPRLPMPDMLPRRCRRDRSCWREASKQRHRHRSHAAHSCHSLLPQYSSLGPIWSVSAPAASPNFALALERVSPVEPAARVLQYNGAAGTWTTALDFSMAPPNLKNWADLGSHSVRAASSAWAVLASVVPTGAGSQPAAYSLTGRALWGAAWLEVGPTTGLSAAALFVYDLSVLPPGAAVVGHGGAAGVRRLG